MCHLFHLVKRDNVYFIRGFARNEICIFASLDDQIAYSFQIFEYPVTSRQMLVLICVTSKVVSRQTMRFSQIREAFFLALIFLSTHAQL